MHTEPISPPQLDALFAKLNDVVTLPTLAVRIIELANRADNSEGDLRELIDRDPVLVAHIMRAANSACYSQSGQVDSIGRAVALLGNRRLAHMALTIVVARQFNQRVGQTGIERSRLWRHSASVAAIAKLLAERLQCTAPDHAFLAGLLHDFGVLMIDQLLAKQVPRILAALKVSSCLSDAVFKVLPFRPEELAAYVVRQSKLPESVAVAIEFHRDPTICCDDVPLVDVINFADYLANRHGAGIVRGTPVVAPSSATRERLCIDETLLHKLWPAIEQCLIEVQQFPIE